MLHEAHILQMGKNCFSKLIKIHSFFDYFTWYNNVRKKALADKSIIYSHLGSVDFNNIEVQLTLQQFL